MSAPAAAAAFVDAWKADSPTFGIINFANADMVGHTGVIEAAVKAVQTVDRCLGEVIEAVHGAGGACIVTADHGNADHMLEPDGSPNTAHSMNPVPLVVTVPGLTLRGGGVLADVAPTMLEVLGVEQPRRDDGSVVGRDARVRLSSFGAVRGAGWAVVGAGAVVGVVGAVGTCMVVRRAANVLDRAIRHFASRFARSSMICVFWRANRRAAR